MPHRVLVIANRTCPSLELEAALRRRHDAHDCEVLVVAPALNGRLAHWVSDTDGAISSARARVDALVGWLADLGMRVRGDVGDGDPLVAIDDALHGFAADEVLIATLPRGSSHWLERRLPERAAARHGLAVEHVETDPRAALAVAA